MSAIAWSRKSLNDLQKIAEHMHAFSPTHEQALLSEILKTADLLIPLPRLGKLYEVEAPEEGFEYRALLTSKRYRIIYRIGYSGAVEFLRVMDVRSNPLK